MSSRQLVTVDVPVEATLLDAGDVANTSIIPFPIDGYGVGKIVSLTIIDPSHASAANLAGKLWIFKASVTQAAADAAHSISDADALLCIGFIVVASTDCQLSALNTVAHVRLASPLPFEIASGGSLYGIYVIDAAPTFGAVSLRFVLGVA